MTERAVTPIQVAVAASDDEHGSFVSTKNKSAVMLAATLTTVENGKVWVPASTAPTRLPAKGELGEWIPLAESMTVLVMHGELRRDKLHEGLDSLGYTVTLLENERDVNIGVVDSETWLLMIKIIKMVQVYRKLTKLGRRITDWFTLNSRLAEMLV
ncbi:hypothetical protein PHMEG_00029003 [Phytophthora megakarya]|uniref:Uncharacterized protein n=1 Tax=Phytophthora megakarya TaxID=4795 RepID=A0A225V222_9STRA|nr:hypothetical protein PHMEG_00029003 [Phytophthora megakarya]